MKNEVVVHNHIVKSTFFPGVFTENRKSNTARKSLFLLQSL